jgi:hypothetical protein
LVKARSWLPQLPFTDVELLIVDEMGKNISGAGMDLNVIGYHNGVAPATIARKLYFTISQCGIAYWKFVVKNTSSKHHEISHREFFDTFTLMGLNMITRYSHRKLHQLRFGNVIRVQQSAHSHQTKQKSKFPKISKVYVRDLSSESMGNALSIDRADYCTTRVIEKIDWYVTYINRLTTGYVMLPNIPRCFKNDREVIDAVLAGSMQNVKKIMRIKNTLHISEISLMSVYRQRVQKRKDLSILGPDEVMAFDEFGNLFQNRH